MIRSPLLFALLATTALTHMSQAQTLPQGGAVAAGSAAISTPSAGRMLIQQGSERAIVNWQGFSVGQGGRVDIVQPNAGSAILNRVTGSTPSSIAGQVNANGQVFLVNPNGISIGPTGQINAAGFVGSSLGISDEDFRQGRLRFQGNGASAEVSNAGSIAIARGGYAALLGGQVSNSGTISVPMGRVGLGAAEQATLDLSGDGFLQVAVPSAPGAPGALVRHSGRIAAPGGRVEIRAATAREAARRAINLSGVVEATAVGGQNGAIVLSGGEGGAVRVSGRLDASSTTGTGGQVSVTGRNIALRGASIDASGATGGGRVQVGGGREGRGPLQRAERVRVDAASVIRADATARGTGGDVVIWSEVATDFRGTITARGGPLGGDGGQAEVSSRGTLGYGGVTDLRAPLGAWGTLLLDPYNITISNAATTNAAGFTATGNDSNINAASLVTALGTANVTVSTGVSGVQAGNITVADALTWSTASTLTLQAAGGINLNAAITAAAGGLTLNAGGMIAATADVSVARFTLQAGNWVQNTATLPGFAATADFSITGGSFLRAAGGDGTTATPYRLTDIYGVQGMGSSATLLGASYVLANDISASGTATWNAGAGFVPVGTSGAEFTGSLDGAGRTITGLTINRPTIDYVGLFGVAGVGSTISNLGLIGGAVTGQSYVGGLVGSNQGTITQSYATGAVTGGSQVGGLVGKNANAAITQSYATGAVTGQSVVGGLVGYNRGGAITQSYATGAVNGTGVYVGGLVGFNQGTITQSYATGAVNGTAGVGGLVGVNVEGAITQSYATGAVTGQSSVGGLVGVNVEGAITQSYATGAVNGQSSVGGLVGYNQGTITQSYATGAVTGQSSVGGLVGYNQGTITQSFWDTETTGQASGIGDGTTAGATGLTTTAARASGSYMGWNFTTDWYQTADLRPIGRWEAATPVAGVTTISNLHQLQLMGANLAGSYRLGSNIDASQTTGTNTAGVFGPGGFVPVGTSGAEFTGSLDGAGRTITGLTIDRPTSDDVGLFGVAGVGSTISNLGLIGGAVTGQSYVGGLVGYNYGTITQSYATGAVTGSGNSSIFVGGLVGYNDGTITQSYATGAVNGQSYVGGLVGANFRTITQSYATGAVNGTGDRVGGLVGQNQGTITQVYATGAVNGQSYVGGLVGINLLTITQSYATGAVTGTNEVGGLVGANYGAITQSFWDTQTTGQQNGGTTVGATGLTTLQMQDLSAFRTTYPDWNFETVWAPPNQVGQNNGSPTAYYPQLYSLSNVVFVSPTNASRAYGDANPGFTGNYHGLQGTDTVTTPALLTSSATATSNVGTYAISGSGLVVTSQTGRVYRDVYEPVTITRRPITVTADAQSRLYGEANPTLSYTFTSLGAGTPLTGALATTATPTSDVGGYSITQGTLTNAANSNYVLTYTGALLSINQRPITMTADAQPPLVPTSKPIVYGEANLPTWCVLSAVDQHLISLNRPVVQQPQPITNRNCLVLHMFTTVLPERTSSLLNMTILPRDPVSD